VVGEVELDGYGIRFDGWDEGFTRTPWSEVLPWVLEQERWRGLKKERVDLPLELARRAVAGATGVEREAVVDALKAAAQLIRVEEEGHLASALEHRGVNWSAATDDRSFMDASVSLRAEPDPSRKDVYVLTAEVVNQGEEPLERALVELDCASLALWDGVVVPVGRVAPGERALGSVSVPLYGGISPREDPVLVRLRADGRPPYIAGEDVLTAASTPVPEVRVSARLVRHDEETHRVEVTLINQTGRNITGLETHFEYPASIDVDLLDRAARLPVLPANASERVDLGLRIGDHTGPVPLRLVVDTEAYGELADWPMELPLDGTSVSLDDPTVAFRHKGTSAAVGRWSLPIRVTDDGMLADVVVYANGEKVAWAGRKQGKVDMQVDVDLVPGVNYLRVEATDQDGLLTVERLHMRGVTSVTVDAADLDAQGE